MNTNAEKKKVILADPLYMFPLSGQIVKAGGAGYSHRVLETPVDNSFSVDYTFETDEGYKTIRTRNTFNVGCLFDTKRHIVEYNADEDKYYLITVTPLGDDNCFSKKYLCNHFTQLVGSLRTIWPKRLSFDLTDPETVLI